MLSGERATSGSRVEPGHARLSVSGRGTSHWPTTTTTTTSAGARDCKHMLRWGRSPGKPASSPLVLPGSPPAGTEDGDVEEGTCLAMFVTVEYSGRVNHTEAQHALPVTIPHGQGFSTAFALHSSSVHLRRRMMVAING